MQTELVTHLPPFDLNRRMPILWLCVRSDRDRAILLESCQVNHCTRSG